MLNVSYMSGNRLSLSYSLNKKSLVEIRNADNSEEVFHLKGLNFDIIPETKKIIGKQYVVLDDQIEHPGFYSLVLDGTQINEIALNHSRLESDPKSHPADLLNDLVKNDPSLNSRFHEAGTSEFTNSLSNKIEGNLLWKYCVILALIFFVSEVMVLKFMKV